MIQRDPVDHRDELLFLLTEAAELEHGLTCSYLFTAFSLKASPAEGLPPETVDTVARWKATIKGIAVEEMRHLALVNSLIVGIGGPPHFHRPNFPQPCSYYLPK